MKRIGALALVVLPVLCGAETAPSGKKVGRPVINAGKGVPPSFMTVRSVNKTQGKIVLAEARLARGTPSRVEIRDKDGKNISEMAPVAKSEVIARDLDVPIREGRIFDAAGKKVAPADAWKRLEVGVVVLVSGDGRKVARTFRKLVKKDTLIFLSAEAR